ncbi:hypothetical protein [Hymenobacter ruber]
MNNERHQQANYKSRVKYIFLPLISWVLVVACYWTEFTSGLIFFGLCALVLTYPLLNSKQKSIFTGIEGFKAETKKDFKFIYNDLGSFTYSTSGFDALLNSQNIHIDWKDIRAIFGYKADLFTTDLICMDIHNSETVLRLTEETAGWYQFNSKLAGQFPSIDPKWCIDIASPAFETTLTLLYEKDGMELPQAVKVYYPQQTK